jgi:hypothetical protein
VTGSSGGLHDFTTVRLHGPSSVYACFQSARWVRLDGLSITKMLCRSSRTQVTADDWTKRSSSGSICDIRPRHCLKMLLDWSERVRRLFMKAEEAGALGVPPSYVFSLWLPWARECSVLTVLCFSHQRPFLTDDHACSCSSRFLMTSRTFSKNLALPIHQKDVFHSQLATPARTAYPMRPHPHN